jgi:hypothetical protein
VTGQVGPVILQEYSDAAGTSLSLCRSFDGDFLPGWRSGSCQVVDKLLIDEICDHVGGTVLFFPKLRSQWGNLDYIQKKRLDSGAHTLKQRMWYGIFQIH